MAHRPAPSIHNVHPDDIHVNVIPDQLVCVDLMQTDIAVTAGSILVAGASDRERLNNLLAIAQRIRTAALDLMAELHNSPGQEWYTSTGEPASFPEAAPLHGTTVRQVAS